MQQEPAREPAILKLLSDVVGDLSELLRKEMELAKAEIAANLNAKLQAGIWMGVAAAAAAAAGFLVIQALVFALMAWGLAGQWACLIVAALLAAGAFIAFLKGRKDAARGVVPKRTIRQIKKDISTTKEQLT